MHLFSPTDNRTNRLLLSLHSKILLSDYPLLISLALHYGIILTFLGKNVPEPQQQSKAKVARMDVVDENYGEMDPFTQCTKYQLTLTEEEKLDAENILKQSLENNYPNFFSDYQSTRAYQRSFIGQDGFEIRHHLAKFHYLSDVSI